MVVGGETQIIPSPGSPWAHDTLIFKILEEYIGTRTGTQIKKKKFYLDPSWGCPSTASGPVSRHEAHQDGSTLECLLDGEGVAA